MKDLIVRVKTIKPLEENTGAILHDLGFGNEFLDMTPKAKVIKEKIDKMDCTKFKIFVLQSEKITHSMGQISQIIYLIRDLYPEHVKNSYNSIMKRYITHFFK